MYGSDGKKARDHRKAQHEQEYFKHIQFKYLNDRTAAQADVLNVMQ